VSDGRERSSIWRILLNRQRFGLFILGASLSNIGTWCQNVAGILLMFRLTGDTALVAMVTVAQYSFAVLLGPYAGVIADRFDRRTILACAQVAGAGISASLAFIIFAGAATPAIVLGVIALLGVAQAFQAPAMVTLTPAMVESRDRDIALSLNSMQFNLARVIGPAVASVTILGAGIGWAFVVNAVSYAFFLATLFIIRPRPQVRPAMRPTLMSGVRAAASSKVVITLLLVTLAIYGSSDVVTTLGPAISVRLWGSDVWVGGFIASFGAGAILMAFVGVPLLRGVRSQLIPLLVVQMLAICGFAFAPNLPVALASTFVFGAVFLGAGNRSLVALQENVDPDFIGRISALWLLAVTFGRLSFAGIQALVASLAGPTGAGAAIAVLLGIVILVFAVFRRGLSRPAPIQE
jgi:MFS family permease